MAEWFNAHAWKACIPKRYRGFESPSLRQFDFCENSRWRACVLDGSELNSANNFHGFLIPTAITVQIDIGTVEVVRLALRGASGRSATRPTSVPKLL